VADGGDFYDHVVSPFEGVPADGSPCHVAGSKCEENFDFRRLGPRGTALLVSPWISAGTVFQEPTGPTKTSQFEHSSISATITRLFNLSGSLGPHDGFLTERDAWVSSGHPCDFETRCCGPVLSRTSLDWPCPVCYRRRRRPPVPNAVRPEGHGLPDGPGSCPAADRDIASSGISRQVSHAMLNMR
jgi:hypothetical protein